MTPITIGLLTFTSEPLALSPGWIAVVVNRSKLQHRSHCETLTVTIAEWQSFELAALHLSLATARAETDRLEISRLDTLVAELRDKLAKWEAIAERDHGKPIKRCTCGSEPGDTRCEAHPRCNYCGIETDVPVDACSEHTKDSP